MLTREPGGLRHVCEADLFLGMRVPFLAEHGCQSLMSVLCFHVTACASG